MKPLSYSVVFPVNLSKQFGRYAELAITPKNM